MIFPLLLVVSTKVPFTNFVPYSRNASASSGWHAIEPHPSLFILFSFSNIVLINVTLAVCLQGLPKAPDLTSNCLLPVTMQFKKKYPV